ncbi:MAG: DUF1501 domain-containing protein [Planctomycetaceae bacterium]
MLAEEGIASETRPIADSNSPLPPTGQLHHTAQADSVIWIFLSGGYSHVETFDPKPALNKYAGLTFVLPLLLLKRLLCLTFPEGQRIGGIECDGNSGMLRSEVQRVDGEPSV